MKKNPYCRITKQGAPVINSCTCVFDSKVTKLFELDLKSKYCEIVGIYYDDNGNIGIEIAALVRSLSLHKSKKGSTTVMFKNLKNYHVFASDLSRYSARICFYNYN